MKEVLVRKFVIICRTSKQKKINNEGKRFFPSLPFSEFFEPLSDFTSI